MFETKNETEEYSPLQTMLFVCWTLLQLQEREKEMKKNLNRYSNREAIKDAAAGE